jgi:uncharacterized membrane protein
VTHQKADHIEKFKTITTEVFALTLGLGAFSLTTIPRENLFDVMGAVATFAMMFFYILIIWLVNSRFFDEYPLRDEVFLGLNFVVLFLVVISPFLSQSIFLLPGLRDEMSILLAVDMMGIYFILGVLHQRYIWQNVDTLNVTQTREVKLERNIQYLIAIWFLTSIFVPTTYRLFFWWGMAPIIPIYRIGIARRRRVYTEHRECINRSKTESTRLITWNVPPQALGCRGNCQTNTISYYISIKNWLKSRVILASI